MRPVLLLFLVFLLTASLVGCRKKVDEERERWLDEPVIPAGFSAEAPEIYKWRCPEDNSLLHFATNRELEKINGLIGTLTMKKWGGFDTKKQEKLLDAALVRADGKIAYRFHFTEENEKKIVANPILTIEEALVLDESVGPPDPKNHRK